MYIKLNEQLGTKMLMKARIKLITLVSTLLVFNTYANANKRIAKVIVSTGDSKIYVRYENPLKPNIWRKIKKGEWINEGALIRTGSKSFVKFRFNNGAKVNVTPNSEIKIENHASYNITMVGLLKGSVRSLLDNVKRKKKEELKFIIRTKTAAIGVRGTDFQALYNESNEMTAVMAYSGVVTLGKFDNKLGNKLSRKDLDNLLSNKKAVYLSKGTLSGTFPNLNQVTQPAKVSPSQFDLLNKNEKGAEGKNTSKEKVFHSPLPPGVDPKKFMVKSSLGNKVRSQVGVSSYKNAIRKIKVRVPKNAKIVNVPPEGVYNKKTGEFALPSGGYIDSKTALYVPPSQGSIFDPNTNTYSPLKTMGSIDTNTGSYISPQGYELTPVGSFEIIDPILAEALPGPPLESIVRLQKLITLGATRVPKALESVPKTKAIIETSSLAPESNLDELLKPRGVTNFTVEVKD